MASRTAGQKTHGKPSRKVVKTGRSEGVEDDPEETSGDQSLQGLAQHDDNYPKDDDRGSTNQQLLHLAIKHAPRAPLGSRSYSHIIGRAFFDGFSCSEFVRGLGVYQAPTA
jgi:hypothetical protein